VERDKKEKMIKQFHVPKYEQFITNWYILFHANQKSKQHCRELLI